MPSLFQLAARSVCRGYRCVPLGLVIDKGICQPPLEPDHQSSKENTVSRGRVNPDGTSVKKFSHGILSYWQCLWISHAYSQYIKPVTESGPLEPQLAMWSVSGNHLAVKAFQAKLQNSSLGHGEIRQTSLTTHSLVNGIAGVMNKVRSIFSDVANFLASLHQEGYQYNSLNAYRSAISSVHERVDGVSIGQHSTTVRLLKGAYNAHPPIPRYSGMWDVQRVLSYIESMGRSKVIELKHVTLKTVFLLAITRPSRYM